MFRLNERINLLAAEMLTLGTSTRYTAGKDTERLRQFYKELSRSEAGENSGGADDERGEST